MEVQEAAYEAPGTCVRQDLDSGRHRGAAGARPGAVITAVGLRATRGAVRGPMRRAGLRGGVVRGSVPAFRGGLQ